MAYLDKRLKEIQTLIDSHATTTKPVMLLLDNINLYHGNRRHHRLFKILGPKMWNFTVRGVLLPNLSEVSKLLESKETTEEQQCVLEVFKARDTFIGT